MLRFQSTFPRGERRFLRGGSRLVSYFNPRSLVGNDVLRRAACPLLFYFNPRSLVGNDGNQNIRRNQNGNFNPRSLVGNDDFVRVLYHVQLISIHVPSWGTTLIRRIVYLAGIFQSTFPRGERPSVCCLLRFSRYFNPRSLVGNDPRPLLPYRLQSYFNPRSLVGNDGKFSQIFFVFLCNKYNFSTFYYPFSLFFSVIHVTFLIFVVRILPAFYVYF